MPLAMFMQWNESLNAKHSKVWRAEIDWVLAILCYNRIWPGYFREWALYIHITNISTWAITLERALARDTICVWYIQDCTHTKLTLI
jgi:hypothetical protein